MARTRNSPALYELISDKHRPVRVYAEKPQPMPPPHTEERHEPEADSPEPVTHHPVHKAPAPREEPLPAPSPRPARAPRHEPAPAISSADTAMDTEVAPALSADKVLGFITPGRAIRVPVGYVFLGLALLIGLCFIVWAVAFSKGKGVTDAEEIRLAANGTEAPVSEPLNKTTPINRELLKSSTPRANQRVQIDDPSAPSPSTTASERSSQPTAPVTPDVVFVDDPATDEPRIPQMNYYVVANLPKAEAERAAAFLASRGVPAARLAPGPNKLCQVIALRAFAPKTLGTPDALQFKSQLLKIGREYKRDNKGPTDFIDMYPDKYKGKGKTR